MFSKIHLQLLVHSSHMYVHMHVHHCDYVHVAHVYTALHSLRSREGQAASQHLSIPSSAKTSSWKATLQSVFGLSGSVATADSRQSSEVQSSVGRDQPAGEGVDRGDTADTGGQATDFFDSKSQDSATADRHISLGKHMQPCLFTFIYILYMDRA